MAGNRNPKTPQNGPISKDKSDNGWWLACSGARSCNHTFHKTIEVSSTKIELGLGCGVRLGILRFDAIHKKVGRDKTYYPGIKYPI
jgi:hypothetical protein